MGSRARRHRHSAQAATPAGRLGAHRRVARRARRSRRPRRLRPGEARGARRHCRRCRHPRGRRDSPRRCRRPLLIGFFAVTGPRTRHSAWFARGSAATDRIVAGEWWRTVTALTLHADASHLLGNAAASVVLVGAVSRELGPGLGLWLVLLAGAGGNALTAVAHSAHHASVGASTAIFGA